MPSHVVAPIKIGIEVCATNFVISVAEIPGRSGSMSVPLSGQTIKSGSAILPAEISVNNSRVSFTWLLRTVSRWVSPSRPARGTLPCTADNVIVSLDSNDSTLLAKPRMMSGIRSPVNFLYLTNFTSVAATTTTTPVTKP